MKRQGESGTQEVAGGEISAMGGRISRYSKAFVKVYAAGRSGGGAEDPWVKSRQAGASGAFVGSVQTEWLANGTTTCPGPPLNLTGLLAGVGDILLSPVRRMRKRLKVRHPYHLSVSPLPVRGAPSPPVGNANRACSRCLWAGSGGGS